MKKELNQNAESLGAVHTHTHTHTSHSNGYLTYAKIGLYKKADETCIPI